MGTYGERGRRRRGGRGRGGERRGTLGAVSAKERAMARALFPPSLPSPPLPSPPLPPIFHLWPEHKFIDRKAPNMTRIIVLRVEGMMCQENCGTTVQNALSAVDGVELASVSFAQGLARVVLHEGSSTSAADLADTVDCIGFDAEEAPVDEWVNEAGAGQVVVLR